MPELQILTGQRFGRLLVIGPNYFSKGTTYWICQCDCGSIKRFAAQNLKRGASNSCGCLNKELIINRSTVHGMRRRKHTTQEYTVWCNIRQRCNDQNSISYKYYGARGISVCERWINSFENFINDMGNKPTKEHSIGRINNNGNYSPDNCRWETIHDQSRNTRRNRLFTINGITKTMYDWAVSNNILPHTVARRIDVYGWEPVRALTQPARKGNYR